MRLVHLSDVHLGFRGFPRSERGWNLRERDLAGAFHRALQEIARLTPDLVLVTGDLFDRSDPPSTALLTASRGFTGLRSRLPGTPILIIAGERDSPRNPSDPGPLAVLDSLPGIEVAVGAPRSVRFRGTGLHALLVPHRATAVPPFPELKADPAARWNVLLIRGEPGTGDPAVRIRTEEWGYVAIGGSHAGGSWGPRVRRAGSLERPGWNPWREATDEKGFLSFDLERGVGEFHPIPVRPVVDLAPVRVDAEVPEAGGRRLKELVEGIPGGIEGKVVRLRLRGDLLTPGEGVPDGLLLAIQLRAAYAEFHLTQEGEGGELVSSGAWTPEGLLFPRGASREPREILLKGGVILLTSSSEGIRRRLTESLRDCAADGASGATLPFAGIRLSPDVPSDPVLRALWGGEADPVRLLRAVLEPRSFEGPREEEDMGKARAGESGKLEGAEASLQGVRADYVEASGDLEAQTMEWARDRQEADSRLDVYRERARELAGRLRELRKDGPAGRCPTCDRSLGEGFSRLLATLEEEWEGVVQDGQWWKRRREQLDLKPDEIREMERTVLRLQLRLTETSEQVERLRERERAFSPVEAEYRPMPDRGAPPTERAPEDLERLPGVRPLLRKAGGFLQRITQGRVSGILPRGTQLRIVDSTGGERPPERGESAALHFALHLALWKGTGSEEARVNGIFLSQLQATGTDEFALPALELLAELAPSGSSAPVLFLVPPSLPARMPECARFTLDWSPDARGRVRLQRTEGGLPGLILDGTVG